MIRIVNCSREKKRTASENADRFE